MSGWPRSLHRVQPSLRSTGRSKIEPISLKACDLLLQNRDSLTDHGSQTRLDERNLQSCNAKTRRLRGVQGSGIHCESHSVADPDCFHFFSCVRESANQEQRTTKLT